MEIKKLLFRREMKLVTLLLTSMLIATASASVYYSMIMQPAVTITGAKLRFVQGSDWPGGTLGTNATWVGVNLNAYPNATLTYDQPLNISNTDSASHTFRLRYVSITPASGTVSVSNFTFINFVVKDAAGTSQASMNFTTSGTDTWTVTPTQTSTMTLPGTTQWIVYVETKAAAGANSNIVANIQIAVDVTE